MHQHDIKDVGTILENRHSAHFPVWESVWKIPSYTGSLWVFSGQTFSWVLISHTHLMEIERKTQHPPRWHVTHYSMQLLEGKGGQEVGWGQRGSLETSVLPSQDQPALRRWCIRARENVGAQRSTTPGLMDIFHFHGHSFSRVDQFLTYPLLIFQDWAFANICLAALPKTSSYTCQIPPHSRLVLLRNAQWAAKEQVPPNKDPSWPSTFRTIRHRWDNN